MVLEAAFLPAESASGVGRQYQQTFDHQGFDSQFDLRKRSSEMDQTLRQLGELLLGAVPTILLLVSLNILYTFLVHRPLTAVLAERRSRTQGAMEKARADIAAAEARTAEYEQRVREARQKVFKNQEARRQQANQSRSQAVNEARARAQDQVKQARAILEDDKQQAMSKLQSDAARLATEIVRTVLRPMASLSQVGGQ
jgi:F-type H+-transporting ATPase subunit b